AILQGERLRRSTTKLTRSNELLIFNKESRRINQFTIEPLFRDTVARFVNGNTVAQCHREVCETFDIPVEDLSFFQEFRGLLAELYTEAILVKPNRADNGANSTP